MVVVEKRLRSVDSRDIEEGMQYLFFCMGEDCMEFGSVGR